jgi:ankyrin repeat protein
LTEAGGDVSAKGNNGWTPMRIAGQAGSVEMVKIFKEVGGYASARSDVGLTPIHLTVQNGHVEAIKALAEACGNVWGKINTKDRNRCNLQKRLV